MNINENIDEFVREALEQQKSFEDATVKCGIIGMSGAGKSSLINAIAGKKIAAVGSTEQTMEAQSYLHEGLEFVDLPGCGTKKWPQESYISDLGLDTYDCFIIVTSNRLYESDIYLYERLANKYRKPCFIVRNKIDLAIEDESYENSLSEEETIVKVSKNIKEHIDVEKIYLVSARQPTRWDFPTLVNDISKSQDGVKQDKFIAGMAVWSKQALESKKKIAAKIVSWSAITSAANGLNPIPGLDVSIDVTVLVTMVKKINIIFCLSDEQLAYLEKSVPDLSTNAYFMGLKQSILKFIIKYATTEGILLVLKRAGLAITIKNFSKFLPIIGHLASAGIGYKMTLSFGESYLDEAAEKSEELLLEILSS